MTIYPVKVHGRTRYRVDCGIIDGKRSQPTFETRGEAEVFLKRAKEIKKTLGEKALKTWLNVNTSERGDFLKAQQLKQEKGVSASWEEIVKFYLIHAQPSGSSQEVSKAVAECLKDMKFRNLDADTIREHRYRLDKFLAAYSGKMVHQINHIEIKDWLGSNYPNPCTRNTYRKSIRELFKFSVAQGWCTQNPVEKVNKSKEDSKDVVIYTNDEVKKLLDTASEHEDLRLLLPFYAIGCFAFPRTCEVMRLNWEDIHLDESKPFLTIRPRSRKTRAYRNIDILPSLHAILSQFPGAKGSIKPINFERLRKRLHKTAEVKLKHNALRHTGASNHLEEFKDEGWTRKMLGHRSTEVLFQHYRALVRPSDAHSFWKIMPHNKAEIVAFPKGTGSNGSLNLNDAKKINHQAKGTKKTQSN